MADGEWGVGHPWATPDGKAESRRVGRERESMPGGVENGEGGGGRRTGAVLGEAIQHHAQRNVLCVSTNSACFPLPLVTFSAVELAVIADKRVPVCGGDIRREFQGSIRFSCMGRPAGTERSHTGRGQRCRERAVPSLHRAALQRTLHSSTALSKFPPSNCIPLITKVGVQSGLISGPCIHCSIMLEICTQV